MIAIQGLLYILLNLLSKDYKEGDITNNLANALIEELNCETAFTIPLFGGIPISETVVVTWIIMAVLLVISLVLTRNLKVENPGKIQLALEAFITWIYDFFDETLGKDNRKYYPYLITVLIYLAFANTIVSFFGFKPPTKDLNMTAALAIMSMCLIEFSGITKKGLGGWVKNLAEPVAIVAPINILEIFIRPLSLCMRLFGNVIGAFIIMELIKFFVPMIIPIPFSFYFDIFDGLLQAYIFVFLTAIFMSEKLE